jgi:hypothetical protein
MMLSPAVLKIITYWSRVAGSLSVAVVAQKSDATPRRQHANLQCALQGQTGK